ncbi:hypothetical protein [Anaerobacillus sp. 1_MG-2023]|uniref:hypothetical protein n=1 Tax=Anaerobacillus sp. 1_MG-2023 TaxID=3062655 RepID=UPI0026E29407|nr:hypothetical protein [Anaerobacillus sp. 1_MG-2023]MDO6654494.1 hypothetical protein [Anaerobacillus sp. 1_MG-2023]
MLNELEEFKRYLERTKYRAEAEALEAYLGKVREARFDIDDSKRVFDHHHSAYSSNWVGEAREAYESLIGELEQASQSVYAVHEELTSAINEEIDRLLQKAEGLK